MIPSDKEVIAEVLLKRTHFTHEHCWDIAREIVEESNAKKKKQEYYPRIIIGGKLR